MMIEWKSQYSVENQRLDEQHQKLFELVNEILEAMKTEKSRDAVFIASVLKQLYEYTQYHFRSEENLFVGTGYPFVEEHIQAHRDFTGKVKEMVADQNKIGSSLNAVRIAQTANAWITDHVMRFDKGYALYIKRRKKRVEN